MPGYVTQHLLPGLGMPVLTCLLGGAVSAAMYVVPSFDLAIGLLYVTWLVGEGWFVGVITALQQGLPPGPARDAGLGLFFALSVLIGAADVFVTSQSGIGEALQGADGDGEQGGSGDDLYSDSTNLADFWRWLLGSGADDGRHDEARRTMLVGVSGAYIMAGAVFILAAAAPIRWPCASPRPAAAAVEH